MGRARRPRSHRFDAPAFSVRLTRLMVRVPRSGPKCPKGTEARRGADTQATACDAASAFRPKKKKTKDARN